MVETREFSRTNGWSWPLHWLQVTAWLAKSYTIVVTFGLIVPAFRTELIRTILYSILTPSLFLSVALNLWLTSIDPADPGVRDIIREKPRPQFDRALHRHVITRDYYCHICEARIDATCKHCRQCNKCVSNFDHHCKWLNNCIGNLNYRLFIAYISTIVFCGVFIVILCLTLIAFFYDLPHKLNRHAANGSLLMLGGVISDAGWLGILISTALGVLVITLLTAHLLIFHIKLISEGLTTYNYIMNQRQKAEDKKAASNAAVGSSGQAASKPPITQAWTKRCCSTDQNNHTSAPASNGLVPNGLSKVWNTMNPYGLFEDTHDSDSEYGGRHSDRSIGCQLPNDTVPSITPSARDHLTVELANGQTVPRRLPPITPIVSVTNSSNNNDAANGNGTSVTSEVPHPNLLESMHKRVQSLPSFPTHVKITEDESTTTSIGSKLMEIPLLSFNMDAADRAALLNKDLAVSSAHQVQGSTIMRSPSSPGFYVASGNFTVLHVHPVPPGSVGSAPISVPATPNQPDSSNPPKNPGVTPKIDDSAWQQKRVRFADSMNARNSH